MLLLGGGGGGGRGGSLRHKHLPLPRVPQELYVIGSRFFAIGAVTTPIHMNRERPVKYCPREIACDFISFPLNLVFQKALINNTLDIYVFQQ